MQRMWRFWNLWACCKSFGSTIPRGINSLWLMVDMAVLIGSLGGLLGYGSMQQWLFSNNNYHTSNAFVSEACHSLSDSSVANRLVALESPTVWNRIEHPSLFHAGECTRYCKKRNGMKNDDLCRYCMYRIYRKDFLFVEDSLLSLTESRNSTSTLWESCLLTNFTFLVLSTLFWIFALNSLVGTVCFRAWIVCGLHFFS